MSKVTCSTALETKIHSFTVVAHNYKANCIHIASLTTMNVAFLNTSRSCIIIDGSEATWKEDSVNFWNEDWYKENLQETFREQLKA
ncbi:hypothetical protein BPOR_0189g00080 [Botrytis porri]|uniref:Uncharacterized protein n=1 Tax=Botrytis porri TaxID=87229 RepID=A0A4Z1KU25_9HELO|nr:hypothetical protein BPOR_0189g00080 [Botrytis porri]